MLRVSTEFVAFSADAGTPAQPIQRFSYSIEHSPAGNALVRTSSTHNGILDTLIDADSSTSGEVVIVFKDPSVLGPGVYEDSLRIGICKDVGCSTFVSGTSHAASVTYTVTGTPPPPPSVAASTNVVSVAAAAYTGMAPNAIVRLTLQGATTSDLQSQFTFTTNGLDDDTVLLNAAGGGFDVWLSFKPSTEFALGTYVDTAMIHLCHYRTCPEDIEGSPVVITTEYTVSETLPGDNGFTIRQVDVSASDVAWDAVNSKLWVTTPATAAEHPDSIVPLDPASGDLGTPVSVGSGPMVEAISQDGEFLYVGFESSPTIQRFRLPDLASDIAIPLGNHPGGPLVAGDIQVVPGQPRSIAVLRNRANPFSGMHDIVVFDDAVPRPDSVSFTDANLFSIAFGETAATLYGSDVALGAMTIDAGGVSLGSLSDVLFVFSSFRLHYDAGWLYTDRGELADPATGALAGTFLELGGEFGVGAVPDSAVGRLFLLVQSGSQFGLRAYDLATMGQIAVIDLPAITFPFNRPIRIVRWGVDGLAIPTGDDRILLINGAFVRPPD
jgi:hypothetical protein